ncbi:DUF4235 domain-containing protein [Citricoccus sp. NPDC079358]|uniref:DUF4235 domain-containing protein n=1 Tax=unclassified Citricoccus TaxID=2632435 RepID=UPI0012EF24A3|nr:DUF4235 domain-containing protein [Citricoccus sp. K5]VXB80333.1 conserved hypothetical protein [Citricoccus sp. K5]
MTTVNVLEEPVNTLVEKLIATGITIGGGIIGTKVVEFAWRKITGHDAPKDLDDTEANMWSAITFATISAGISAIIRVSSKRGANSAVKAIQSRSKSKAGTAEV